MCQYDHLVAGLDTGIDGGVHGVQAIWDAKISMEYWGFLLLDVKNTPNEINQIRMLWTVCHLWPYGAHFVFTCYCQFSSLVSRNGNGTDIFLHSREGVAKGYLLSMVVYAMVVLPLIKLLKSEYPDVTQTWYADDYSALGTFDNNNILNLR